MKLQILAFALSMPLAAMASAAPMLQEQPPRESGVSATPAKPRHPLFTFKYVLVDESRQTGDNPRIDPGDGRAAIHAVPLSDGQWRSVSLEGGFRDPNMYVCSSWGCMGPH
jgi:hypothetical protein